MKRVASDNLNPWESSDKKTEHEALVIIVKDYPYNMILHQQYLHNLINNNYYTICKFY